MGQLTALDSYLSLESTPAADQTLALEQIHLPKQQPRRYFDPQKMEGLVESIQLHGILEPLLVRLTPNHQYELVAGERRYRAAKTAGLTTVPVVVRSLTDQEALQIALIENLQREDLNPVEETEGILQLLAIKLQCSVHDVRRVLYQMKNTAEQEAKLKAQGLPPEPTTTQPARAKPGKQKQQITTQQAPEEIVIAVFASLGLMTWDSFVKNRLPILNLPTDILDALQQGQIAYTKAIAISRVKDSSKRQALLKATIQEDLSIAELRERITAIGHSSTPKGALPSPKTTVESLARRVVKAKLWENPKKWKQAQTLLAKLEALIADV
jgi:ParB family chromosome partitioning protein